MLSEDFETEKSNSKIFKQSVAKNVKLMEIDSDEISQRANNETESEYKSSCKEIEGSAKKKEK